MIQHFPPTVTICSAIKNNKQAKQHILKTLTTYLYWNVSGTFCLACGLLAVQSWGYCASPSLTCTAQGLTQSWSASCKSCYMCSWWVQIVQGVVLCAPRKTQSARGARRFCYPCSTPVNYPRNNWTVTPRICEVVRPRWCTDSPTWDLKSHSHYFYLTCFLD